MFGNIEMEYLGGNRYFVIFIDDPLRKVWTYFLRTKKIGLSIILEVPCNGWKRNRKPLKCLPIDNEENSIH